LTSPTPKRRSVTSSEDNICSIHYFFEMQSRRGINAFLVLLCGLLLQVKYSSGSSLSRNELFARDTCTYTQGSTSFSPVRCWN
jgi:hypothetical protein